MKRKISVSVCLVLMLISAFVSFQITYTYQTNKYEGTIYGFSKWSEFNSKLDDIEEIAGEGTGTKWQNIYSVLAEVDAYTRAGYIGEINEEHLLDYVMTGYMYGTDDKYAAYMPKSEYDAFLLSSTEGSMVGIGVRIIYDNNLGGIYVTSVVPDSPAQLAGIKPGDVIVGVEGQSVSDIGYYGAYNVIKNGTEGQPVVLTVAGASDNYQSTREVTVIRSVVAVQTVRSRMINDKIACIEIYEFTSTTPREFISAMETFRSEGVENFVFDVRNNPGGSLDGVAGVLDYLLPEGPIIRCISKTGDEQILSSDAKCIEANMVVLVNEHTASAGELFTAALRDYDKATVIGTTTYGKGSMQTIIPISNGGAIKMSTQMYNPPFSDNYDGIGIVPDKTVELSDEAKAVFYKLTDEEDVQLMSAVDELKNK